MKFETLTDADDPTDPVVGVRPDADGVRTVNWGPEVAEVVASETTTDCAPAGAATGTVKLIVDTPFASVVAPEVIGAVWPPILIVSAS